MTFQKGNKLAPGGARPGAGRKPKDAHTLLKRILSTVSASDWADIIERSVQFAKAGDIQHTQMLLAYQFGKPVQRTEVSGPDGGPLEYMPADDATILAAADEIREREAIAHLVGENEPDGVLYGDLPRISAGGAP